MFNEIDCQIMNGLIIDDEGDEYWYKDNILHREDGPAIEWVSGSKFWVIDGNLHRMDGPAIYHPLGISSWYYHGKFITNISQEDFERKIKLLAFI